MGRPINKLERVDTRTNSTQLQQWKRRTEANITQNAIWIRFTHVNNIQYWATHHQSATRDLDTLFYLHCTWTVFVINCASKCNAIQWYVEAIQMKGTVHVYHSVKRARYDDVTNSLLPLLVESFKQLTILSTHAWTRSHTSLTHKHLSNEQSLTNSRSRS